MIPGSRGQNWCHATIHAWSPMQSFGPMVRQPQTINSKLKVYQNDNANVLLILYFDLKVIADNFYYTIDIINFLYTYLTQLLGPPKTIQSLSFRHRFVRLNLGQTIHNILVENSHLNRFNGRKQYLPNKRYSYPNSLHVFSVLENSRML